MENEKEYKITFTTDYIDEYHEWKKWAKKNPKDSIYESEILSAREEIRDKDNLEDLAICKKWRRKTIKLSKLPKLVKEVGRIILREDEVEIYNDYRE